MAKPIHPLAFFAVLRWIDGSPLLDHIEPYRRKIFAKALFSFDDDQPHFNRALCGRGKKNWKTADLVLAVLYRFLAWREVPQGFDSAIIANDEDQANDDLELCKKIIRANPVLDAEVVIKQKEIERNDGKGSLVILPARDVMGLHGKSFHTIARDEIHGLRTYDTLEATAQDPTRTDAFEWICSYASIYNTPGAPLFDMVQTGKRGDDPRMFFSWYAGDYTTDPALQAEGIAPEVRANPSMATWTVPRYLQQQRARLPSHKFRRLHLNLPGMPDGAYFSAEAVMACVIEGRKHLKPQPGTEYRGFVDMAGGSGDDATCGIAHKDQTTGKAVLDLVITQTGRPPYNPRDAVQKFAAVLKEYGIFSIVGDRFAGETFRQDFQSLGVTYTPSDLTKHQLYEALEPRINAAEVELLDHPGMQEQLLGLVTRGSKIDHQNGDHDDLINAAAGALHSVASSCNIDFLQQGAVGASFGERAALWALTNETPWAN